MSENQGALPVAGDEPEGASSEAGAATGVAEAGAATEVAEADAAQTRPPQPTGAGSNGTAEPAEENRADLAPAAGVRPSSSQDTPVEGAPPTDDAAPAGSEGVPRKRRRRRKRKKRNANGESATAAAQPAANQGNPSAPQEPAVHPPTEGTHDAGPASTAESSVAADSAITASPVDDEPSTVASPKPPATPTPKDVARFAATLAWVQLHEAELGRAPSPASQAEPPEDLEALWRADDDLYQLLVSEGARRIPAARHQQLVEDALEKVPTLSVVTALLETVTSRGTAEGADAEGSADSASQDSASQDSASQDSASQDSASQDSASQDSASQDSASQDSASQDSAGADSRSAGLAPNAHTDRRNAGGAAGAVPPNPFASLERSGKSPFELLRRVESRVGDVEGLLRLLSLLEQKVPRNEWIEWLLAMYENRDLKRTIDGGQLPQGWRALVPHARTLGAVVVRGQTNQWGARQLHHGVRTLLRAGARSLMSRPPIMRERLVRLALKLRLKEQDIATVSTLLDSLEGESCALPLALEHVRGLLAAHHYERANQVLQALVPLSEREPTVNHWLKALSGPRYGNIALLKSRARPPLPGEHPLRPGLWLAQQKDVWLRVGTPERAAHFAQHVENHRRAEMPGVSVVIEHGFTKGNRPYVAYERKGENARFALAPAHGASREDALETARQLLQLAYGLARCGVVLPDAELARLERDVFGRLWLVETWGCRVAPLDAAQEGMLGILRSWLVDVLFDSPNFALKPDVQDTLRHAGDFATVRATLDVLSRSRLWEP